MSKMTSDRLNSMLVVQLEICGQRSTTSQVHKEEAARVKCVISSNSSMLSDTCNRPCSCKILLCCTQMRLEIKSVVEKKLLSDGLLCGQAVVSLMRTRRQLATNTHKQCCAPANHLIRVPAFLVAVIKTKFRCSNHLGLNQFGIFLLFLFLQTSFGLQQPHRQTSCWVL